MKKIIFLSLLVVANINAQDIPKQTLGNPDGERISLHITPFYNSGAFYVDDKHITDFRQILNFDIRLRIPFGRTFTLTPFYEQRNFELSENYFQKYKTLQVFTKMGMTVSIYF